ncbi:probable plastid-lipid-associated protein 2, chloroplastic [Musa acuminata AAA Group]|uniref:probable plastid-lipid-associated protein 2, chloroplastic n=1 Tax=Musa acuminata AAA Group TaxID=214697 RepID=UPI0031CEF048
MAAVASWKPMALKAPPAAVATAVPRRNLVPTALIHMKVPILRSTGRHLLSRAPILTRAVVDDDEQGEEGGEEPLGGLAVTELLVAASEVSDLKKKLMDLVYGTDWGLKTSSETRAEIVELIGQIEAKNPTPAPTDALTLLDGKWILAYTSFSALFPLLASGRLPSLVKVDEISQSFDSESFTMQNSVKLLGPLATTSVTTSAKFEVRSPKRVQIKFEEGIIGTPQLTDNIVIPDKVEFLGQSLDLSLLDGVFKSIQNAASSVVRTISGRPPLKISINNSLQSWLLTTYLDEELRISRDDAGSVFVLTKANDP